MDHVGPRTTDQSADQLLVSAVSDRIEVSAVLHRLARAMDSRDWVLLVACFTPDAVGDFATGPVRGAKQINAQYQAFLTPLEVTQHFVTNTEVAVAGDTATATSYVHAQHVRTFDDSARQFVIGARYDDVLQRTAASWQISHRKITGLWSDGDRRVVAATLQPRRSGLPPGAETTDEPKP